MNPILTAVVGDNGDLFAKALPLFTKDNSVVLDATYGNGVFWKKLNKENYVLYENDLDPARGKYHYDFRSLPIEWTGMFDAVVLDPPYASRSSNKNSVVGGMYNNNKHQLNTVEDMLKFYFDGMKEARKVLKMKGVLYVKCQDEVASGKQRRNHIDIFNEALRMGFIDEDMFTLVQESQPIMRHAYQFHARKNNSFLWVFKKK